MPASLFYSSDPPLPNGGPPAPTCSSDSSSSSSSLLTAPFGMDHQHNLQSNGGGLNLGGSSCNGTNPTEQLALQLALLQGGLQPTSSTPPVTEWSTGVDGGVGGSSGGGMHRSSGLMDDLNRGMFNGGNSSMANFRGSLEDLKMPPQRKSQNMTECVPVPTSEHVAEIVGRQGCKIKALRAKTNTYIKTPVRGEEPVFVVTGRKEDVSLAKREILSAADHFSQIRASRKSNINSTLAFGQLVANQPGQTTVQVRVPYRVVGLVVGPKGATIKRIQQQTRTYIVTPSRDKEPVFEVTGLPENVEVARKEIEAHIAFRTGSSDAGSAEGSTSGGGGGGGGFYGGAGNLNDVNGDDNVFNSNGGGGGGPEIGHFGARDTSNVGGNSGLFPSTSSAAAAGGSGNQDNLGNNHHHHPHHHQNGGISNNFHHGENSGGIFGSSRGGGGGNMSRDSAAVTAAASLLTAAANFGGGGGDSVSRTGSIGDRSMMNGHHPGNKPAAGITLQNILDSGNFDLISNGLAAAAAAAAVNATPSHSANGTGPGFFHQDSSASAAATNGWGNSQDSGINNSPPFDKATTTPSVVNGGIGGGVSQQQQQAAVERSGSGIWGDLNKALGGMKISPPSPKAATAGSHAHHPLLHEDKMTRASVDLGTLGRPALVPLTSSNSLTLIGGGCDKVVDDDVINTANNASGAAAGGGVGPSSSSSAAAVNGGDLYHHPAVVPTSSTGSSSSVASLSEMSPPNSLPHFLSAASSGAGNDDKAADCHEENNLKKLIMMRNEELLRQNEMNEKKSSFEA